MNEKHLEFLQNNITRMNQCSFQMKGWAITIVSAFIAAYVATISDTNPGNKLFIIVAVIPTVIFWLLDSLYLSKENKFIGIYNDVAGITEGKKRVKLKAYEIPMKKYKGWKFSIFKININYFIKKVKRKNFSGQMTSPNTASNISTLAVSFFSFI